MTSVNHSNNLCFVTLDCPTKCASGSGDSYCKSQETKIKEAKNELEKCKNDSDEKSKKEKDLKKLQSGLEEHIAKDHSLDDSTRQAKIKEVTEQQNFVKKFKSDFDGALDAKSNILENLCDGLEKFLGYDKTSKGYDGSGIVYSDLDRLCDAVMGFLKGVLESVKEDDAVKKYDGYMTDKLENVLHTIQSSIGSGRAGLAASVDAVKGWLEGYEGMLKLRTESVTGGLEWLNDKIEKLTNTVEEKNSEPLECQLDEWKRKLTDLVGAINTIENQQVSLLDNELRGTLKREIKPINATVTMLFDSAANPFLKYQVKKVDDELTNRKNIIVNHINAQSRIVWETVDEGLKGIQRKIIALSKSKTDQFKSMKAILTETQNILTNDIDVNYTTGINSIFDNVRTLVEDVHQDLITKNSTLTQLAEEAQRACVIVKEKVQKDISKTLNDASIEHNWMQLQWQITSLVNDIKGDARIKTGLQGVKLGVVDYAQKFNNSVTFGAIILDWIKNAVKCDVVKGKLDEYANAGPSGQRREEISSATIDHIGTTIKRHLDNNITAATAAYAQYVSSNSGGIDAPSIATNVMAAGQVCEAFAMRLESEIISSTPGAVISQIATHLQHGRIVVSSSPSPTTNPYLTEAIQLALTSLCSTARQVANELKKFTESSNIAHVENAINTVDDIGRELKNERHNSHGELIDKALADLKSPIETLIKSLVGDTANQQSLVMKTLGEIQSVLSTLHDIKVDGVGVIGLHKKEATKLMDELKSEIKNRIHFLQWVVSNGEEALTNAISDVQKALLDAFNAAEKIIENLKTTLLQNVEVSFNRLTAEIKSLFAESHRADLSALRCLVDQQLQQVQGIIEQDKVTGVKGMLKTLSGVPAGTKHTLDNDKNMLDELQKALPPPTQKGQADSKTLSDACPHVELYMRSVFAYNAKETERLFKPLAKEENKYHKQLEEMYHKLKKFFDHISKKNYDHKFVDLLSQLNIHVSAFPADTLPDAPKSVLAPKSGLSEFAQQLGHAYVSRYSGGKMGELTVTKTVNEPSKPGENGQSTTPKTIIELTPEGRNCAKVCLTIVEMVHDAWWKLIRTCNNNKERQINLEEGNKLGYFFYNRGYSVTTKGSKQDGELRNDDRMKNTDIKKLCEAEITVTRTNVSLRVKGNTAVPIYLLLRYLTDRIDDYSSVCHLRHIGSPRAPTNVNQMLHWLSGLRHNSAYGPLCTYFKQVIPKPEKYKEMPYDKIPEEDLKLPATTEIKYKDFKPTLVDVCAFAKRMLVCILGHGHADGRYACEFSTNADGLDYPSSASACFDTLVDILNRVYHQFSFLYKQCCSGPENTGWEQCWYGRDVAGSDWRCNKMQIPTKYVTKKSTKRVTKYTSKWVINTLGAASSHHSSRSLKTVSQASCRIPLRNLGANLNVLSAITGAFRA